MKGSKLSCKIIAYISCRISWIYQILRLSKSRIQYKFLEYIQTSKNQKIIEVSFLNMKTKLDQ